MVTFKYSVFNLFTRVFLNSLTFQVATQHKVAQESTSTGFSVCLLGGGGGGYDGSCIL